MRVEHVSPSKCRDELKRRVKENEAAKKAAKEGGGECNVASVCAVCVVRLSLVCARACVFACSCMYFVFFHLGRQHAAYGKMTSREGSPIETYVFLFA